jgi:glycosyltransferase involved in cell wall biosynthesis
MKNKYIDDINYYILNPPVECNKYITNTNKNYVTLINLNENKGGDILIEIAKRMPDVEFLGVEGGYYEQIIDKSVKNIIYIPHTSNMKEVYANTDILLMPSKIETWGRTASEAICSGIPVIANPTEGIKENLEEAGIYIERTKINEWVQTIRKLKSDKEYYKKQSEKCKLHSRKAKINQMEGLRKRMET